MKRSESLRSGDTEDYSVKVQKTISKVPSLSSQSALAALDAFGCIGGLSNASLESLQEKIPKMGKKRAENIRTFFWPKPLDDEPVL